MKKPGVLSAMVLLAGLVGCGEVGKEQSVEPAVEPAAGVESVDAAGLEQFITAQMEELHIPGVAVAIVDRERVVLSAGYGWADVENQIPMTPDTVTNIASISKTFTNAAVMQLVEKGRLGLDDDVGQHLPFPVRHPAHPEVPITVRQLLTHTSGIEAGELWGHNGADPGIRSYMQFNAKTGRGVIVFANRATRFTPIAERLWAEVSVAGGNS